MPWVILDGTGSLRIGSVLLKPGAQEVTDPHVLERIRVKNYPWITVTEAREVEQPLPPAPPAPEPEPEAPEEPYERFQGRDGKWYYLRPAGADQPAVQSEPFDTEEAAEEAIQADQDEAGKAATAEDIENDGHAVGPLLPSELTDTEFPCRAPGCGKKFRSTGARKNHERIFHRDLSKQPDDE